MSNNINSKINNLFFKKTQNEEVEVDSDSSSESDFEVEEKPTKKVEVNYSEYFNKPRTNKFDGLDDISMLNRIEKMRLQQQKEFNVLNVIKESKKINDLLSDELTSINDYMRIYKAEMTTAIGRVFTNAYEVELLSQNKKPDNYSGTLRECLYILNKNITNNCENSERIISERSQVIEPALERFSGRSLKVISDLINTLQTLYDCNPKLIEEIENKLNNKDSFDDLDSIPM